MRYIKFENEKFDSASTNEVPNLGNITIQLQNNSLQCGSEVLEFVKFAEKGIIEESHNNIKLLIDDLKCDGPDWMANKTAENLDPMVIQII